MSLALPRGRRQTCVHHSHVWELETPRASCTRAGPKMYACLRLSWKASEFSVWTVPCLWTRGRFPTGAAQPESSPPSTRALETAARIQWLGPCSRSPSIRRQTVGARPCISSLSPKSNNIHAEQHRVVHDGGRHGIVIENGGSVHPGGINLSGYAPPSTSLDQNRLLTSALPRFQSRHGRGCADSSDEAQLRVRKIRQQRRGRQRRWWHGILRSDRRRTRTQTSSIPEWSPPRTVPT
jgi:hypothetical protein